MTSAIEVTGLSKRFGNVTAVESLTFAVAPGTFYGFLGPNGAGKSTTIGCLTGLLDPTAGDIRLLGHRFDSGAVDLKRRIGVMPEHLGLFDYLYAPEFLAFHAQMYGLDRKSAGRRIAELLDALGLANESRKPLGAMSAGMRKRVAFAAAILHVPDVLFLDEPFESIDPAGVALMKQWLRRMTSQGRTVFLTTHVLDAAERLCDRAAIVTAPGRVVWEGDLTPLNARGRLQADGESFRTLEELFLFKTGQRYAELDWL